jgi:hypothetical protein
METAIHWILGVSIGLVWICILYTLISRSTTKKAIQAEVTNVDIAIGASQLIPHLPNYNLDPPGSNRPFGDLFNFQGSVPGTSYANNISTLEDCAAYCDKVFGCVGFVHDSSTNNCFLKNAIVDNYQTASANMQSAVRK